MLFSHVWLFATTWTVACQALLSMRLSWQEYWSGLPEGLKDRLDSGELILWIPGPLLWEVLYWFLIVSWINFIKSELLKMKLPHKSSLVILCHLVKMVVIISKGQLNGHQGCREESSSFLEPSSSGERSAVVCAKFFFCLSAMLYSPDQFTKSSQESHSEKNRYKAG